MNVTTPKPNPRSQHHDVQVTDLETVGFYGELLGSTESHQLEHFHEAGRHARKNERCYACRWSEYRIYRVDEWAEPITPINGTERYVVVSYGVTVVPGERTFRRVDATSSPAEVVQLLTTRKYGQPPRITSAAAKLLARVSDLDEKIQEAWDSRAVL